ncbi:MAG: TrbI/VirB10 family protein [Desmonostoc vinosum HA7617-LM4]|jgi:hypothetical protein|nr:TrbI/VirB10 family protein [Desmonostoc vinosum HA7617-LM4]
MTQYSITGDSAQRLFTLTDDRQKELDSSDWESRMARLVGFEEELTSFDNQPSEDADIPEYTISQPPEAKTQQPLSANPFAKLGLVGAGTLAIVLVAGVFLSQLMSGTNQKPKTSIVVPQVRSQPTESRTQQLETEVETLKTKLALSEQAEVVKAAQQKLRTAKSPTVASRIESPVASRSRVRTEIQRTPAPTQTVRIVTVPAPQRPVASIPASPPPVASPTPVTPPPKPDPLDEWSKLAKLGSYGQVNVTEKPNVVATNPAPPNNIQPPPQSQNPVQPPQPQPPVVSQVQQQNPKSVPVGSSVKAVLATAVFGETTRLRSSNNSEQDETKNVFVVRLKEPLKSTNGEVALPANTEFLTEIRSISEQGLLQLDVVKLVIQDKGNITEKSLPQNAITIRAPQGRPLIANQFSNKGGSITGMDVGLFALGAVGKVGEILNRNDSQVTTVGNSTTITSGNTRRNILAGLLEGGMNTVVPQIAQRNQQAISQMMQRTNIWFLAAGKNVEIYVNQSMQF